jgi:hypothetical protein
VTIEEMRAYLESLPFQPGRPGMRPERQIPLPMDIPPEQRHLIRTTPIDPQGKGGPQFDPKMVPIVPGSPAGQLMFDPTLNNDDNLRLLAKQTPDDKLRQWMLANQPQQQPRDAGDNKGAV